MSEQRAALTDGNGNVTSVIIVDSRGGWEPPKGLTMRTLPKDSRVAPGWSHNGTDFVEPERPAPPVDPGRPAAGDE